MQKARDQYFAKFEQMYLHKRNDIMFVFKFISPYIPSFQHIKANHGIAMFVMSKKAFLELKAFLDAIEKTQNIFKLPAPF